MEKSDLLYGVSAIAGYLGMRVKQCRNRVERKQIPTFKFEGTVCARRSTLDAWIAGREAAATAGADASAGAAGR